MLLRNARLFLAAFTLLFAAASTRAQSEEQQKVAYEMEIQMQAGQHQMTGTQRLTYTNTSPDTLHRVFYHLYFNAFKPTSMMAERNRHLPDPDSRIVPRIFNLGPEEVGYHRIQSLTQDGQPVDYDIDDTVMEVTLAGPIPPGASSVFRMRFRSQVPLQTRRSGRDNREGIDYSMTQWYPKIAAYDEQGWHADPYVGREFYAPYGSFDVEITLPARYTIGATGVLQNPGAVGHGYALDGSGIYRPSDLEGHGEDMLTWHFTAEHVHDFAWAADPDYIHRKVEGAAGPPGTVYHLFYQTELADRWEPMARWVPAIIDFYSEQYGPYAYPQFTVAQGGDGGMEYPMLNLITGRRSPGSLLGVTAHEAAHEWFYAMLGSNEADYAWMDEGFTSYASTEAFAHVAGRPPSHTGAYLSVIRAQDLGLFEPLNTPADWYTTNYAYGVASYPGGQMLVDMLGYVISDSLRDAFLQEYYDRFRFDHPQPRDLEKIAEDVSGLRLDWYFEQVTDMDRRHDYALENLEARRLSGGSWRAVVTLERQEPFVLPADVRIDLEDGSAQWVNVPLTIMEGHKPVPDTWRVAQAWPWTFPEHTFTVKVPARPVAAEVDPRGQTPEVSRLDNTTRLPVAARFLEAPGQSWTSYRVGYRPLVQYAHGFGVGAGAVARGQYLFGEHRARAMLKLWPQVLFSGGEEPDFIDAGSESPFGDDEDQRDPETSFFDGIDYELAYEREVPGLGPEATAKLSLEKHLGFLENTLSVEKPLSEYGSDADQTLSLALVHQLNPTDRVFGRFADTFQERIICDPFSCPDPSFSVTRSVNTFQREHMLSARFGYEVTSGRDRLAVGLELGTSLWRGQHPNGSRFWIEARKTAGLGPFTGKATFNFGFGDESLVLYKRFRLGAAPFEERWQSDAFRTVAAAFDDPLRDAHLAAFSGAGPVAYLGAADNENDLNPVGGTPFGRNLLAGALSLETGPLAQNAYVRPFRLEVFYGLGEAWSEGAFLAGYDGDELLADAGVGARYDLSRLPFLNEYTAQSDVLSGLQVVAKFPFWANRPQVIDPREDNEWAFRWRLGLAIRP